MDIKFLTAADGSKIRFAYAKPDSEQALNKQIIFLPGRTSFIERQTELFTNLLGRGFTVWSIDWRGQGGSTRTINHPQKNHIYDFDYYLDDLHQLIH